MRIVFICVTMEVWPTPHPIPSKVFKLSREILHCIWKIYWGIKSTRKDKCKIHLVLRKYHHYLCTPFPSAGSHGTWGYSSIMFCWSSDYLFPSKVVLLPLFQLLEQQHGPILHSSPPWELWTSVQHHSKLEPVHAWLFRALEHWPTAFSYPNLILTIFSLVDCIFQHFRHFFTSLLILLFLHVV